MRHRLIAQKNAVPNGECEAQQDYQQITYHLTHFEVDVPALEAHDGMLYIPAGALCSALGIRAESAIRRWRKMLLWEGSRKLQYRDAGGVRRTTWCLPRPMIAFACANCSPFPMKYLEQLRRWLDEENHLFFQAHAQMLTTYRTTKQSLYDFLNTKEAAIEVLQTLAQGMADQLDSQQRQSLNGQIEIGCLMTNEAADCARKILMEQSRAPIVDALVLYEEGTISNTYSFPLCPVLPQEQVQQFIQAVKKLNDWYISLFALFDTWFSIS